MSNARIICLYILHLMVAVLIGVGLQDAAGRHVAQAIGNLAGLLFFLAVYRHVSGGKLFAWRPEKRIFTGRDMAILAAGSIMAGIAIKSGMGLIDDAFYFVAGGMDMGAFQEMINEDAVRLQKIWGWPLVLMLATGAVREELIYRKYLQGHFAKYGLLAGAGVSAVIFAAIHFRPDYIFAALLFSLLYVVTGHLWAAMLAHFSANMFFGVWVWLAGAPQAEAVWALGVLSFALCVMFAIDSVRRVRAQGGLGAGA